MPDPEDFQEPISQIEKQNSELVSGAPAAIGHQLTAMPEILAAQSITPENDSLGPTEVRSEPEPTITQAVPRQSLFKRLLTPKEQDVLGTPEHTYARRLARAGAVAAVLAIAACSGGDPIEATPTPTPSESTTKTPEKNSIKELKYLHAVISVDTGQQSDVENAELAELENVSKAAAVDAVDVLNTSLGDTTKVSVQDVGIIKPKVSKAEMNSFNNSLFYDPNAPLDPKLSEDEQPTPPIDAYTSVMSKALNQINKDTGFQYDGLITTVLFDTKERIPVSIVGDAQGYTTEIDGKYVAANFATGVPEKNETAKLYMHETGHSLGMLLGDQLTTGEAHSLSCLINPDSEWNGKLPYVMKNKSCDFEPYGNSTNAMGMPGAMPDLKRGEIFTAAQRLQMHLLEKSEIGFITNEQLASEGVVTYTVNTLTGDDGIKVVSIPYPKDVKPPIAEPDLFTDGDLQWRVFVSMGPAYTEDSHGEAAFNSVQAALALCDSRGDIYGSTYAVPLSKNVESNNRTINIGTPEGYEGQILKLPDGTVITVNSLDGPDAATVSVARPSVR